jgi:hypothetical protein
MDQINWIFSLFMTALGLSVCAQIMSYYAGPPCRLRRRALMLGIGAVFLVGAAGQLGMWDLRKFVWLVYSTSVRVGGHLKVRPSGIASNPFSVILHTQRRSDEPLPETSFPPLTGHCEWTGGAIEEALGTWAVPCFLITSRAEEPTASF